MTVREKKEACAAKLINVANLLLQREWKRMAEADRLLLQAYYDGVLDDDSVTLRVIKRLLGSSAEDAPEENLADGLTEYVVMHLGPEMLPGFSREAPGDDTAIARWFCTGLHELAKRIRSQANDQDPIRATDWQFPPGEAVYKSNKIPIKGIRWKLLKAFVENDKPLTVDNLSVVGWEHDEEVSTDTLRTHLSEIRKLLRRKLNKPADFDPLPCQDRGSLLAWELHADLR